MDRGRDRRYDDRERPLGGETYRPAERYGRSPPRADNYRAPRSPPRRRTPPFTDTYAPRGGRGDERPRSRSNRRRSRSPATRGRDGGGGYRGRGRSPRRGYSPHRDARARSPVGVRRYSRSPYGGPVRARSPLPQKRSREPGPIESHRQRSPPPPKRERLTSPARDGYDRRGHSPVREAPHRYPRETNYRPKERSRTPPRRSEHESRVASPMSSRRSSPQVHPDRMVTTSGMHSPAYGNARQHKPLEHRSPPHRGRERSPPRRAFPQSPRSSPHLRSPPQASADHRERSPPPRNREGPRNGATPSTWSNAQMSAPSGPGYRNGEPRAPPSGPGGSRYDSYSRETPSGPPSAPISMSAHNRPSSASLLSAPTRPRGGTTFSREPSRDASYNQGPPSAPMHRPNRQYNAPPPPRQASYDAHSPTGIPTGPRSNYAPPNSAPAFDAPRPPFRTNNSSSTTYPRTQRFHQHLSNLPAIIPGGKAAPSGLDPAQEKRLQQLEDDKKKLLEAIEEKQKVKRQGLREWEKAERESAREGLRSEFAEGHLERLSGEGGISGGAY